MKAGPGRAHLVLAVLGLGVAHVGVLHGFLLLDNLGSAEGLGVTARGLEGRDLLLDPEVSELEAVGELGVGLPAEHLVDAGVVGVAAAHSLWAGDVLVDEVGLAVEALDELGHVVHGDHLVGADVKGLVVLGAHEAQDALDAVVDEGEGAGLLAVAPHLKGLVGADDLAAEGGGGLLASAGPGAVGAVDVVEACDAALHVEVAVVGHDDLLGVELLQTVDVLGLGGPGVVLLEGHDVGLDLLELGVGAGGRRVEEALAGTVLARGLDHVEGDHGVVVADDGVARLDEAHATHVGGQVVHLLGALGHRQAVLHLAQVHEVELVAEVLLLHELVALPVRGHDVVSFLLQAAGQVRADEPTGASHADLDHFVGEEGVWEEKERVRESEREVGEVGRNETGRRKGKKKKRRSVFRNSIPKGTASSCGE